MQPPTREARRAGRGLGFSLLLQVVFGKHCSRRFLVGCSGKRHKLQVGVSHTSERILWVQYRKGNGGTSGLGADGWMDGRVGVGGRGGRKRVEASTQLALDVLGV